MKLQLCSFSLQLQFFTCENQCDLIVLFENIHLHFVPPSHQHHHYHHNHVVPKTMT